MDVCETKNMDQFHKAHVFEPMKIHTFGPNIRLIRLFSLMLNYAKPRLLNLNKGTDKKLIYHYLIYKFVILDNQKPYAY